jgi:hypothetical protein
LLRWPQRGAIDEEAQEWVAKTMGEVIPLFRRLNASNLETTALLVAAYESVIAILENQGRSTIMHEVAARRIMAAASTGERDPRRLCAAALKTIDYSAAIPRRAGLLKFRAEVGG